MAIDPLLLEKTLCERLCSIVTVHRRTDGILMIDTPFTFPDGDSYPVYLSETPYGKVVLSDRGHTMMHISYENDVDMFYEGRRSALRERIVKEAGIDDNKGVFSIETPPDRIADSLFALGQALTRIYDLTFLNRERVNSTFYEDLKSLLFAIIGEDNVEKDYIPLDVADGGNYRVDYRIEGRGGCADIPLRCAEQGQGAIDDDHAVAFPAQRPAVQFRYRIPGPGGDSFNRPRSPDQCLGYRHCLA